MPRPEDDARGRSVRPATGRQDRHVQPDAPAGSADEPEIAPRAGPRGGAYHASQRARSNAIGCLAAGLAVFVVTALILLALALVPADSGREMPAVPAPAGGDAPAE